MKLITHKTNLHYLIGFTGSAGFLLMGKKQNYFFTDFRYQSLAQKLEKAKTRVPFEFVLMDAKLKESLKKIAGRSSTIEFESKHMTVEGLKRWKKLLPKKKWSPIKQSPEDARTCKDASEIKALKASQKINEDVFLRVKKLCKAGVTELEIAWKIKSLGHDCGADDISFEPIVAFGPSSASPHHQNSTRKLRKQDVVLIDMGMKFQGYCSDMTRTFFIGKPTTQQAAVYQKVLDAQLAGISKIKAGTKASAVDKAARASMGEDQKHFGHSFGHGIGLDVHEGTNLSSRSTDTLKENMIVTAEPGIYLPGKFGVRIEDMGRVTKKGYENFTKLVK